MLTTLAVVDDPLFVEHRAPEPHPERPERLAAARAAVERSGIEKRVLGARDATDDELGRVHEPRHLERLGLAAGRFGYFDADTYFCPQSVAAARRAAGGAIAMVDSLLGGEARFGAALLRPPGHHALPGAAMGFCLINNVAVAAAHARACGAQRVLIVDWDVHHGNGTQEIFYRDPSVLFVSLHQSPFYPGTGATAEHGSGPGAGFTLNVPLSAGADAAVYVAAFERIIAPVAAAFDPDLVLVSAGFDAHRRDPLASMALDDAAYAEMLSLLVAGLPRGGDGRLGLVLEGGYDLEGLGGALEATLRALTSRPPARLRGALSSQHEGEVSRARAQAALHWKLG